MSARDIIEELPRLTGQELRAIEQRIVELTRPQGSAGSVRDVLLSFAGTCEGLPADFAAEHDHYLYAVPKRDE